MAQLKSTSITGALSVSGTIKSSSTIVAIGNFETDSGDICSNVGDIHTVDGAIYTSEGNISANNGDIYAGGAISSEGNITSNQGDITANCFNATSDARLKENFEEYTADKSILNLPIYKYDYIAGAKSQIGCKAQDLQEICPEIVHEREDGYLTIQESKIVYLLIEEIKQLKKEIAELKGV